MAQGKQRSVDPSRFSMVPRTDVPRSAFDCSFGHKTTFDAGFLVPVYLEEVLPGDSIRCRMTAFARLATPLVPVMDNMWLESFFFFVPNRLVWTNWERFMGQQDQPSDTTQFMTPYVPIVDGDTNVGALADYFGITVNNSVNTVNVLAFPFRAYQLIWNDWFRDEDLQTRLGVPLGDGPDGSPGPVLRRGKRFDYFTSCRPWPQKPINMGQMEGPSLGGTIPFVPGRAMLFPQAGVPVSGLGVSSVATPIAANANIDYTGGRSVTENPYWASNTEPFLMKSSSGFPDVRVLINDIRTANVVQVMLERNARGGTRYSEIVRSHFGVISPDARLNRPEYLGGGRAAVNINPVAQTSASGATGTTTVLGELAGIGTAVASGHGFSASFTEHGFIMGMVCVRAEVSYQQGINRMWFRRTQYDYYWPGLANLGEQAILSKEIFADGSAADLDVFGYNERWSEYKYRPSLISGAFRSISSTPADIWHLSQLFASRPVLNAAFIEENPPMDRVLQVATNFGEQFLFDSVFDCRLVRAMPMHSIPGLGPRL